MSETVYTAFSYMVKSLRKQRNLTQQELAARLGVHRNTIGAWEKGEYLPESKTIVLELARILKLDDRETHYLLETSLIAPTHPWMAPYQRFALFSARETLFDTVSPNELVHTAFSDMVKSLRKQQNLTQQELATRLGVHRNTIGVWERGEYLPESQTIVLELARILKLDPGETQRLLEVSLTAPTYPCTVFYPGYSLQSEYTINMNQPLSPSKSGTANPKECS